MSMLGDDFSGGLRRRMYWPISPLGFWYAVAVAVVLLLLHQGLQAVLSYGVLHLMTGSAAPTARDAVKASLVVIFPASLIVAAAAWWLAGLGGQRPAEVLNLRWPRLSLSGWVVLTLGFMVVMYLSILAVVLVLGIDLAQYTPGPNGESPKTGSAGLVKEAMFDIARDPWLFLLVFPSVAIGAPLAEELIFRGQLFGALSRTRLGVSGATLLTATIWSLLHVTEPWLSISLIFMMGLAFGWMMYRFGSLWVPIILHGIWNGFYALLIFTQIGGHS
jgi:membrane protease YdiL (CAAX protease family)